MNKCGKLINKIKLYIEPPEALINHIICRECYIKNRNGG